jgi:hypothetical protein
MGLLRFSQCLLLGRACMLSAFDLEICALLMLDLEESLKNFSFHILKFISAQQPYHPELLR